MRPWFAGTLVFGSSAAVLVLEILAGRLLAPYVGITLETFTAIIGIVLAGIALGTWVGGWLADRVNPRLLIGPELFLGGVASLLAYPIIRTLGPALAGGSPSAVVLLAATTILIPAALLSAVSPAVVKAVLADLDHTGRVVGRLSALGTAGAIIGTFLAGFVLVAALPTSTTVTALGILLLAAGAGVWWWSGRPATTALLLVPLGLGGGVLSVALPTPCDVETAYSCARIVPAADDPSGRLLLLNTVSNSYVDLDDPTELEFTYTRMFAAIIEAHTEGPVAALHIGGGGFTMPRWVAASRPGSENVVIEVDEEVVNLAFSELGPDPSPTLEVIVEDARVAVPELEADRFDIVLGDAYSGLSVPWHLTTVEFTRQIDRTLASEGVYAINVIDHRHLRFLRAEIAPLQEVFAEVAVLTLPERYDTGGNFVILASHQPLRLQQTAVGAAELGLELDIRAGAALAELVGDAVPLTDDHAPVDQLLD